MPLTLVFHRDARAEPRSRAGHDLRGGAESRPGPARRADLGARHQRRLRRPHRRGVGRAWRCCCARGRARMPSIRLAGAAYLLYLGISMWRSAGRGEELAGDRAGHRRRDLPAGRDHQHPEPEGRDVLPRVPAAVHRSGARAGGAADAGARADVQRVRHAGECGGGVAGRIGEDAARVARRPRVVSAGERRDSHRAGTAARARAMDGHDDPVPSFFKGRRRTQAARGSGSR